jgi:hypothetical protein
MLPARIDLEVEVGVDCFKEGSVDGKVLGTVHGVSFARGSQRVHLLDYVVRLRSRKLDALD